MSEIHPATGVRRRAGRKQGAVILLGSSLTIMGGVMVAPVLPKIGAELAPLSAHGAALVPLVATIPALAIALFAPVAGWLAHRFGRRWLLILGTLAYALTGCAPSQMHTLEAILLARLLFGIAEACIMTCCTTLIGDYWQGDERLTYVNRQVIAIGLVGTVFFVIGGAAGEASWRYPFYLYLLPLLLVPFMLKLLWEPERTEPVSIAESAPSSSGVGQALVVAGFLALAGMAGTFIVPVQAPGLLLRLGISSTTMIGMAAGAGLLATLLGSVLWPLVRARAGASLTNAVLLGMIAAGLICLTQARSYQGVLAAVVLHGIGAGMLVPNAVARLLENLPAALRPQGVGVLMSCLYLGQFVSPLLVALLAGPEQEPAAGINHAALALLALSAAWIAVALLERRRPAHHST